MASDALALHAVPGVPSGISPLQEAAVVLSALGVINSLPLLPLLLFWLFRRARASSDLADAAERRRAWGIFITALSAYLWVILVPVRPRPGWMQSRLWRWWLQYFSVRVAYQGKPLPPGQYFYCCMPHGLYPFSGAMACVSKMVDVFPNMRMIAASIGFWVPFIRQLMGWIGCIGADKSSIAAALQAGSSVCVFPGGIAEMVMTSSASEQLVLRERKGFVRLALENGVPLVPVYVFGQSILWTQATLPQWVQTLSRLIRISLILPCGRFGLLVPRRLPLLYAVGDPIACPDVSGHPTMEQVEATHKKLVCAVQDLYDTFKGVYGWNDRPLEIN